MWYRASKILKCSNAHSKNYLVQSCGKGDRLSCSIITLEPTKIIDEVHDRMPFILANETVKTWLDSSLDDPGELLDLIVPYPSDRLQRKQHWPSVHEGMQYNLFDES